MDNTVQQAATSAEELLINRSLRKLMTPSPAFELKDNLADRQELEAFIAQRFDAAHGAHVSEFLPYLLSIRYPDGYSAALGMRPAGSEPLFLEQYLDAPVEQTIAAITKSPIDRNAIVEIGNLVSSLPGATALLFLMLAAMVHKAGFQHVIFTATAEVQRAIQKLGFVVEAVCPADPGRLKESAEGWGRYYDNNPQVMVGFVPESIARCSQNRLMDAILCIYEDRTIRLAKQIKKTV